MSKRQHCFCRKQRLPPPPREPDKWHFRCPNLRASFFYLLHPLNPPLHPTQRSCCFWILTFLDCGSNCFKFKVSFIGWGAGSQLSTYFFFYFRCDGIRKCQDGYDELYCSDNDNYDYDDDDDGRLGVGYIILIAGGVVFLCIVCACCYNCATNNSQNSLSVIQQNQPVVVTGPPIGPVSQTNSITNSAVTNAAYTPSVISTTTNPPPTDPSAPPIYQDCFEEPPPPTYFDVVGREETRCWRVLQVLAHTAPEFVE